MVYFVKIFFTEKRNFFGFSICFIPQTIAELRVPARTYPLVVDKVPPILFGCQALLICQKFQELSESLRIFPCVCVATHLLCLWLGNPGLKKTINLNVSTSNRIHFTVQHSSCKCSVKMQILSVDRCWVKRNRYGTTGILFSVLE